MRKVDRTKLCKYIINELHDITEMINSRAFLYGFDATDDDDYEQIYSIDLPIAMEVEDGESHAFDLGKYKALKEIEQKLTEYEIQDS